MRKQSKNGSAQRLSNSSEMFMKNEKYYAQRDSKTRKCWEDKLYASFAKTGWGGVFGKNAILEMSLNPRKCLY